MFGTNYDDYICGCIVTSGNITQDSIVISSRPEFVYEFNDRLHTIFKNEHTKLDEYLKIVNNPELCTKVCERLGLGFNDKTNTTMKHLSDKWSFINGMFDEGSVFDKRTEECRMFVCSQSLLNELKEFIPFPCVVERNELIWKGANMIDFIGEMYKQSTFCCTRKKHEFYKMIENTGYHIPTFKWKRVLPDAVAPSKTRLSDTGYDLTLIKHLKTKGNVLYYDTGIQVVPPLGYYFELVGRSSISKSGWMLANNIGIIDCSYTGTIIVALTRVNPSSPNIVLPCRLVQLIPRQLHLLETEEVAVVDETNRKDGGFGSTN